MQWPIICDLTRTNHRTPFIFRFSRFRGVITKNSRIVKFSNLETSNRKRGISHKRPTAILLVNAWPLVMRINYNVKARRKTIRTLHWLVFYSESVTHTDRIIGLVWMHLYSQFLQLQGMPLGLGGLVNRMTRVNNWINKSTQWSVSVFALVLHPGISTASSYTTFSSRCWSLVPSRQIGVAGRNESSWMRSYRSWHSSPDSPMRWWPTTEWWRYAPNLPELENISVMELSPLVTA